MSDSPANLQPAATEGEAAPAVHGLHEYAFSVPDLAQAEQFYRSFGLDVRAEHGGLGLYTDGATQRWGLVLPGAAKRLLWLSFAIAEQDLAAFERKLDRLHLVRIAPPAGANPHGLWIAGADGLPVQLLALANPQGQSRLPRNFPPEIHHAGRAPQRELVGQVRPRRLSHILLFTPDVARSRRFYEGVLGLKLSDHSGDIIAFLHGAHGSDHHLVALAKSSHRGLHHSSWDVASFDEVALGSEQMARAGHAQGWGIGRHVLGSNYFRYVRDPWGSYAEYSFDIDYIAEGTQWPAGDYPPEDSLYLWGPELPQDFIVNHEPQAPDAAG